MTNFPSVLLFIVLEIEYIIYTMQKQLAKQFDAPVSTSTSVNKAVAFNVDSSPPKKTKKAPKPTNPSTRKRSYIAFIREVKKPDETIQQAMKSPEYKLAYKNMKDLLGADLEFIKHKTKKTHIEAKPSDKTTINDKRIRLGDKIIDKPSFANNTTVISQRSSKQAAKEMQLSATMSTAKQEYFNHYTAINSHLMSFPSLSLKGTLKDSLARYITNQLLQPLVWSDLEKFRELATSTKDIFIQSPNRSELVYWLGDQNLTSQFEVIAV
jgi:hypothetical protein